jgi:hypothetical protein
MRSRQLLIFVSLLVLLSGCASEAERKLQEHDTRLATMTAALEAQGDADSLATAALLADWNEGDRSHQFIARAVKLAPERADLAWLHVSLCRKWTGCDDAALEARLHALDPANGAAWFGPLERAAKNGDAADRLRALTALGQSETVNLYWLAIIRMSALAIRRTRQWSESETVVNVIGEMAAAAIPAYQRVSQACKGAALDDADTLAVCRGVARSLMHGDTYLTQFIGVAIGKRVWPVDSAEGESVREFERVQRFRMNEWEKLSIAALATEENARLFLEDAGACSSESDLALAELKRAGEPIDPPPGEPGTRR